MCDCFAVQQPFKKGNKIAKFCFLCKSPYFRLKPNALNRLKFKIRHTTYNFSVSFDERFAKRR